MTKGFWLGKPLEEYTKEELIEIVLEMGRINGQQMSQKWQDIRLLTQRS